MSKRTIQLSVIAGVEGPSLCLDDADGRGGRRIAGPKPWGGGQIIHQFKVDVDELYELLGSGRHVHEKSPDESGQYTPEER